MMHISRRTRSQLWKPGLLEDRSGASTLEVVVVIAVLLAIALLFNTQIRSFAQSLFSKVFNDSEVLSKIGPIGS